MSAYRFLLPRCTSTHRAIHQSAPNYLPQHFVLESRDPDSEDRNFSPVFFNVSGSIEVAVPAMDHGWCFAYTCQKRLSTFWTYLPCE